MSWLRHRQGLARISAIGQRAAIHIPESSPAGRFKGRDPTVAVETLADNWVADARRLYRQRMACVDAYGVRTFGADVPEGEFAVAAAVGFSTARSGRFEA